MAAMTPRTVLITGAAGGIGRAMVAAVLAAGHRVAALDRDAGAMSALMDAHPGAPLHPVLADLSTAEGCAAGVAAAVDRFGGVDALVNNAGIGVSSLRPDAETRLHPSRSSTPRPGTASSRSMSVRRRCCCGRRCR